MTEDLENRTPSPEAEVEEKPDTAHAEDDDPADFTADDAAEWPEPFWEPPEVVPGWVHHVDPPSADAEALRAALNAPGMVVIGLHPYDSQISSNWLRKLLPEPIEDETHLFMDLNLDPDEYPEVNERSLLSHICSLHAEKVSEAGVGTGDLPMVAVVTCGTFTPSLTEREQNVKRLERRGITLVLILGSDELARFSNQHMRVFDLDTIDVAFREIVKTLERVERHEDLDPCLQALYDGLSVHHELATIRSDPKQRYDFREALDSKLREAASGTSLALEVCKGAIKKVTVENRASATAILQSLGLANEGSPVGKLDLDELAKSSSVQEPFATAVFLLWAWHGVRKDRVNEDEFKSIFLEHLKVMSSEEQRKADRLAADAKRAGLKRKQVLKDFETPATKLLSNPELIDRVIEAVGAEVGLRNGVRHVGYGKQTQDVLKSHIPRVNTYVKDQIERLEYWLDPIFSNEKSKVQLGRFLFIHNAERAGLIDSPECRQAVVGRLVQWVEIFDDPRLSFDADEAEFEKFLEHHKDSLPPFVLKAARQSKVGRRNQRLRRKIVSLIAHWYNASLDSVTDDGAPMTKHFTTLVTDLLQRLLHRNKPVAFLSLMEQFLKDQPELLNVQSLFRIAANHAQAPFIGRMLNGGGKEVQGFERDSYNIGRLGAQASAYRYIVSELSDEDRLLERKPREQWAISSLALRVLPGVIQRLQQVDYETVEDTAFSSDALMAIILASENGIEEFVDTVMNDRVRLYPAESLNWVQILAFDSGEADEDRIRNLLVHDLCLAEFHCRTIWFRVAQHTETTPETLDKAAVLEDSEATGDSADDKDNKDGADSKDSADDKKSETDAFVARSKSEIWKLWWDHRFQGKAPERLAEYQLSTRLFSYTILQEFHGMLLCSGRTEQAERLLKRMYERLPQEENWMLSEVVHTKTQQFAQHEQSLMIYRGSLLDKGEDLRQVDLWLSFVQTRSNVVFEFM